MQGKVISFIRTGEHDDFAHPNAVVLHLTGDQYLCVAGLTPGKEKYTQAERAEFKLGIWGDEFAVEVDHAKYLTATPQAPPDLHVCGYISQTAQFFTKDQLLAGRDWGTLDVSETRRIAECLLKRQAKRPDLAKNVVKMLKQFLAVP